MDGGSIFFEEGGVVHATTETELGAEAFYVITTRREGSYAIVPAVTSTERSIHLSTDELVLEAQRRLDR